MNLSIYEYTVYKNSHVQQKHAKYIYFCFFLTSQYIFQIFPLSTHTDLLYFCFHGYLHPASWKQHKLVNPSLTNKHLGYFQFFGIINILEFVYVYKIILMHTHAGFPPECLFLSGLLGIYFWLMSEVRIQIYFLPVGYLVVLNQVFK